MRSPIFQKPTMRRRHSMPQIFSGSSLATESRPATLTPPPKKSRRMITSDISPVPEGRCPTCGVRLYKMPSAFWKLKKNRNEEVKPLHVPGKVDRGQCLICCEIDTCDNLPPPPLLRRQTNIRYDDFKETYYDQENVERTSPTSLTFVYEGDYNLYGQRHGHGEMTWENGDRYVGNFFNGLRDGKGDLFRRDGSNYSGEWELNEMHGKGTRLFSNRDIYAGQYARGARYGQGKMHFHNGDLYVGSWKNDRFHGPGKYFVHAKGLALEGAFSDGKKNGKFKVQHADGTLDIYKFESDAIMGHGVRWSVNRDKTWLLAKPHDTTDERWILGRRMNKKRIPIVEAVSIGYACEKKGGPIEPISLTATLSTTIPQVNGRMLI